MRNFILFLLFVPTLSFSQSESNKKICELGVGGYMYLKFSEKLKVKVLGNLDGHFANREGQLYNINSDHGDNIHIKAKLKSLRLKYLKQKNKFKKEYLKKNYKNQDLYCKRYTKGDLFEDSNFDLKAELDDIATFHSKKQNVYNACLKSKKPMNYIADLLNEPTNIARDYNMLSKEIKDRFIQKFKNEKVCNIDIIIKDFLSFSMPKSTKISEVEKNCNTLLDLDLNLRIKLNSCKNKQ
jgi:hypothetical protein